ncbi:hypothetical protein SAMN05444166_4196 [Singulisphaera sp. GP187]|uniref:hypothetical protein n=1 Tax=Singulisphaera sp. GP187 TaxID=1882752 RepID=UPI00092C09B5|nr:hypothetical protein [Singulisphaera sp. GP187]SIO37500.1 hypothetical protein SAMN05444166_4196 [Singulisphaera sp. GP187]
MVTTGDAPPFQRGETFYNGGPIDTTDLGGVNYEGMEWTFTDNDPRSTSQSVGSGRSVTARITRNVSGGNLKGGRLARFKAEDPYESRVDGYTFAVGDRPAGIIDEYLPSAGVPNNDLFWLVIDGPTQFTQLSASAANLVIGDRLVPGAGTSATNDDAGRVAKQDVTGAAATLANNIQNSVGYSGAVQASTVNAKFSGVIHRFGK